MLYQHLISGFFINNELKTMRNVLMRCEECNSDDPGGSGGDGGGGHTGQNSAITEMTVLTALGIVVGFTLTTYLTTW